MNEFTNLAARMRADIANGTSTRCFINRDSIRKGSTDVTYDESKRSYGTHISSMTTTYTASMIGRFKKPDAETARIKLAGADVMNAHLIMVEIMMSSVTNLYVHSAIYELKQRGMIRHNVKRRVKALEEITTSMMERCKAHDNVQVRIFTQTIFPSLTEAYIGVYGSLVLRLQNTFTKHFGNQLTLIKVATKNALDKAGIKISDIATDIQMVALMCTAGIQFYNTICNTVDKMLYGISHTTRMKSLHNEKMLNAAKDLLRELGCDIEMSEEDGRNARKFAEDFKKELIKEDLLKVVENGIMAMQMEFIEFVIASLRIKLHEHTFTVGDYRMLLLRLGSKADVRSLLSEIEAIPLPEDYSDIYELMESLPASDKSEQQEGKEDSFLGKFRRLSLDDHIITNLEREEEVEKRKLRREVYRKGEPLPMFILRYLYHKLGTKKAVTEYLISADKDVMAKTLNVLKSTKADELKLVPGKEYGIFVGPTIKELYELRGYDRSSFAKKAGIPLKDLRELEEVADISHNPAIVMPIIRVLKDLAKILNLDIRHVLFATLKPTGAEGEVTKMYAYMAEMLEPKKETEKPEDNENKESTSQEKETASEVV